MSEQIDATIEAHQDELFALVKRLIAFPTESPPARNTTAAQNWVAQYLRDLGFRIDQWEVAPGDPNVVGILPGSDPERYTSLLVNAHIDVAHVGDPKGWRHPPFEPIMENNRIYGRGASDMKGGLGAALFAIAMLRGLGIELKGDLLFESVIGEEMGEAGTRACVERGYRADFAVCADSSNLELQGQGGVITGWITIESPQTFHDAMRARMIHAGGGIFGASAIEKMVKIINGLQDLERHWAVTKSYPGFPAGTTTINPAVIEGGRHPAFVADRCALWCTVHFYPDQTYDEVIAEVETHIRQVAAADPWLRAHPPTFRWGGRSMLWDQGEIFPALAIDPAHPAMRLLAEIHTAVRGRPPQIGMSPTVTDGGWLGWAGIPAVIYGPGSLQEAHAINESVSTDDLLFYSKVLARFIARWCNTPK